MTPRDRDEGGAPPSPAPTRQRAGAGPRDWDAATYDRVSEPQVAWAREVLARLPLEGHETVLDAGCGSGRVTALLVERLPRGRVIAVDASPSMVAKARQVLRSQDAALVADLTELRLPEPVDAVLSTAVFHWIADHDRLFERLHGAMRPGGRLVALCGGRGNVDRFHEHASAVTREEPFASFFAEWEGPWNFPSAEGAADTLARAGFVDVHCALEPRAVRPPEPREYLRAVCLGPHLEMLPAGLHDAYLDRVLERVGAEWATSRLEVSARRAPGITLDYVRLNLSAARAA